MASLNIVFFSWKPTMTVLKFFLLHEDPLVRDTVGFHFYESWSPDRDLVPLAVEACERYGEMPVIHLLSFACRFQMSHRGVVEALRILEGARPPFAEQWIALAPLPLVAGRNGLLERRLSPRALARLERRQGFDALSTTELWSRLESRADELDRGELRAGDWDEADDLVEALSRCERPQVVLSRLSRGGEPGSLHRAMFDAELAGAMQLQEATPRLLHLLGHEMDELSEAAGTSLVRFGNPGTIRLLREQYEHGSWHFRRRALSVLKAVKLEIAERALRSLIDVEPRPELRARIFDGLRFHFSARAGAALREELLRGTSPAPREELQKALYVFSRIFGFPDPEAEAWRLEAKARGDDEVPFHFPL